MKGKLIIAKPYLGDSNFERAVVLVCEHSAEGAFGLVLNQSTELFMSSLFEEIDKDLPVNIGGPVERNTVHYLHQYGSEIEGSIRLDENIFWSGSFDQIMLNIKLGKINVDEIRFFVGYSGWGAGQLEAEIAEGVWVVAETSAEIVFESDAAKMWNKVLRSLGGDNIMLANAPIDPRLN